MIDPRDKYSPTLLRCIANSEEGVVEYEIWGGKLDNGMIAPSIYRFTIANPFMVAELLSDFMRVRKLTNSFRIMAKLLNGELL